MIYRNRLSIHTLQLHFNFQLIHFCQLFIHIYLIKISARVQFCFNLSWICWILSKFMNEFLCLDHFRKRTKSACLFVIIFFFSLNFFRHFNRLFRRMEFIFSSIFRITFRKFTFCPWAVNFFFNKINLLSNRRKPQFHWTVFA